MSFGLFGGEAHPPDIVRLRLRVAPHGGGSFAGLRTSITVHRTASFDCLRAILQAQFGDSDRNDGRLRQWIFFRDRDGRQVGRNHGELVSLSITERDVLVAQEVFSGGKLAVPHQALTSVNDRLHVASSRAKKDPHFSSPNTGGGIGSKLFRGRKKREVSESDSVFDKSQLHQAICESRMSCAAGYPDQYASSWERNPSPRRPTPTPTYLPRNDDSGSLISHGSISQYSIDGGRSACTSICLVAVFELLCNDELSTLEAMPSSMIDSLIRRGIEQHNMQCTNHSSVEELWGVSAYSHMIKDLTKGDIRQGSVARRQNLVDAFQACIDFALDCDRLAILLTKSGETVLCLAEMKSTATNGDATSQKWYLFDSHGQSHEQHKLAYLKQFQSFHELLNAFLTKYPPQRFGDGSLQADMYNLFEAVPIISREGGSSVPDKDDFLYDQEPDTHHQPIESPAVQKTPFMADKSSLDTEITEITSESKQSRLAIPDGLLAQHNFQCAISMEIMADPVVCSDGKTYDRPNIERHFDSRREQKTARIEREEAQARGDDANSILEDDCCCGAARPPIVSTSPITGEQVDEILTPVHMLEQQIVMLMERNYFCLAPEDLSDWHSRRKEKISRDLERAEEVRRQQERQSEMERNAAEAIARRGEGGEEVDHLLSQSRDRSQQVRVDRDTNEETEMLGEYDLGVSVALADKVHRIPVSLSSQGASCPRCMVACCAVEIQVNEWCARCGRLVCTDCLRFGVTNIQDSSMSGLHKICFECVSQIVDAIDSPDIRVQQKRVLLVAEIDRYLTQLSNRAALKQDDLVRHETHDEFGGRIREVEQAVNGLESQLQSIQAEVDQQVRLAKDAAADVAPSDDIGSDCPDLAKQKAQVEDLQAQYNASLEEEGGDELELVLRRTDLASRLEEAQANLVIAQSARFATTASPTSGLPSSGNIQADMIYLQAQLDELLINGEDETEDQELTRTLEASSLLARINDLGIKLAIERSEGKHDLSSGSSDAYLPNDLNMKLAVEKSEGRHDLDLRSSDELKSVRDLLNALENFTRTRRRKLKMLLSAGKKDRDRIIETLCKVCNNLFDSPTTDNLAACLTHLNDLLSRTDDAGCSLPKGITNLLEVAREDIVSRLVENSGKVQESSAEDSQEKGSETTGEQEDILHEYLRLSAIDASTLDFNKQIELVARRSALDAILRRMEEELFQSHQTELPSRESSLQGRQDLEAIGNRLPSWPLPLGLQYPSPRMDRQLEVLRNTLALRLVESKRCSETYMNDQYNALVRRRDDLEDEIATARQSLQDAESHAREEEERRQQRAELRQREEEARQARERALVEEARRAREATETLRRQHAQAEAATEQAFANAGGEGGASRMGGAGDFRMCPRCHAGPVENIACSDLRSHNNSSTSYGSRTVASVNNPNACPHCGFFTEHWHRWLFWDGIYGPH